MEGTIAGLDRGEVRVAEKIVGDWVVNESVRAAILLYFRLREMETVEVGPYRVSRQDPVEDTVWPNKGFGWSSRARFVTGLFASRE